MFVLINTLLHRVGQMPINAVVPCGANFGTERLSVPFSFVFCIIVSSGGETVNSLFG